MYNNKAIIRLLWPILIEQALNSFIGITNTVIVSNVGSTAVAAVGLVESLNMLVMFAFISLATGATVIVSQLTGGQNFKKMKSTVSQSNTLIMLVATILMLILLVFGKLIFKGLFGAVEYDVMKNGLIYLRMSAISYPFMACYSTLTGVLRGKGDSRTPMYISIAMNVVNISIGVSLIFGLGLGIYGAGVALIASRVAGAAILVFKLIKEEGNILFYKEMFHFNYREVLKPVLDVGIPSGVDSIIFNSGKLVVQTFLSKMGTDSLQAYSISNSIFSFICIPGNTFQVAIMTVTGQCYGAKLYTQAKKSIYKFILFATIALGTVSLLVYISGDFVISIYHPTIFAATVSKQILLISVFIMPLFWPSGFILPSGLRAMGDAKYTMIISIISMWTMRVFLGWLFGVYFGMGVPGTWLGMGADWALRGVFYQARLFSKKYRFKDSIDM